VGQTVVSAGAYYSNLTGYNDVLTNIAVWFPVGPVSGPVIIPLALSAGAITGTDPFYSINLSSYGFPSFPKTFMLYIDINGTGDWQWISSPQYDAATQILNGMNSPTGFPSQQIKIYIA